jgi:hypothetical protein
MKAPKNGGTIATLATNQPCPGNLVLDVSNVYWINQGTETSPNDYQDGVVMEVAKSGGTPIALATKQYGQASLAVDDANVYWTTCGKERGVLKVSKEGGTPALIVTEQECPRSIGLDASNIYWISGDTIKKADKRGGTAQTIAPSGGSALAVDQSLVYSIRTEQTSRTTYRSCADERSVLLKVSKDGGTPTRLAELSGYAPDRIAMDESSIYWANDCSDGIRRIPKSGGDPTTVIANIVARHVVVDVTGVYWTGYQDGTIMKKAK